MKHKHAEMIKAKADNMALVVFENDQHGKDEWYEIGIGKLPANHRYSYFLCLPQHKEACLHWLNGGESQTLSDGCWFDIKEWRCQWSRTSGFMREDFTTRIKPKKEKRLIAIDPKTSEVFVATSAYIANDGFQLIEIEVEV